MKGRAIVAVMLVGALGGIAHGFNGQKYAEVHADDLHERIGLIKEQILDGKLRGSLFYGRDADALMVLHRNMLVRPPCEKVRIVADVFPHAHGDVLTREKAAELGEMIKNEMVKGCAKYAIGFADANDWSVPVLATTVFVRDHQVGEKVVYTVTAGTHLREVLVEPMTGVKVVGTSWGTSQMRVYDSASKIEAHVLRNAGVGLGRFLWDQYEQHANRAAQNQLEEEGRLPGWWTTEPSGTGTAGTPPSKK